MYGHNALYCTPHVYKLPYPIIVSSRSLTTVACPENDLLISASLTRSVANTSREVTWATRPAGCHTAFRTLVAVSVAIVRLCVACVHPASSPAGVSGRGHGSGVAGMLQILLKDDHGSKGKLRGKYFDNPFSL